MAEGPDRVVVLNDFSSERGGAAYLARLLARRLAASGRPVTFIAGDAGPASPDPGVEISALGGRPLLDRGAAAAALDGLHDRRARAHVAGWIAARDTPGTIYHLHNWSLILSPSVFDALAPVADRCAIHAHDYFLACPNGAFFVYPTLRTCALAPMSGRCATLNCDKRGYAHKAWRVARHALLRRRLAPFLAASRFVAVSEAMGPLLRRGLDPTRLTAIENPVEPFGPPQAACEQRRGVCFVGALQVLKGVFDVAEAGRRLGVVVDFIGDGEDRGALERRYPEHRFHGWLPRAEIAARLGEMRVGVAATLSPEPFCLAAFELVASGLPLVVSDAIPAAGRLTASGAALAYRGGDADALTAALGRVLRDDALAAAMGAAARQSRSALSLSSEAWVAAHEALYAEMSAARASAPAGAG